MFRIVPVMLAVAFVSVGAEEVAIMNSDFSDGLKYWASHFSFLPDEVGFSVEKENGTPLLAVVAATRPEYRSHTVPIRQKIEVPKEKWNNQWLILSLDAKVVKLTGTVLFSIREVDKKGQSIRYYSIRLGKWDPSEWKRRFVECVPGRTTDRLEITIQGVYLEAGDKVLAKNLKLELRPR